MCITPTATFKRLPISQKVILGGLQQNGNKITCQMALNVIKLSYESASAKTYRMICISIYAEAKYYV